MTVRRAVEGDRFAILRLGKAFLAASGLPLPFNAAWAERTVRGYIVDGDKLCLVYQASEAVQGVLLAHAGDHPFGPFRIAAELIWWIDPDHRGVAALRMLDAYEAWAQDQGCAFVGMASLKDERVDRLYIRRGYRAAETHFLKAL